MTPVGGLSDERFTILQMVQDGTITPEEGARLLEAMDRVERTATPPLPPKPIGPRNVHIKITSADGKDNVDLSLPFGLVDAGLNIARRIAPGKVPDTVEIRKSVEQGFTGNMFNFESGSDHIEISIEERD